jgi:hypothetical protein
MNRPFCVFTLLKRSIRSSREPNIHTALPPILPLQCFSSGLAQEGDEDDAYGGFLPEAIKAELSRISRLVSHLNAAQHWLGIRLFFNLMAR